MQLQVIILNSDKTPNYLYVLQLFIFNVFDCMTVFFIDIFKCVTKFFFFFQRATLAEKEVTNLKEQLAVTPLGGPRSPSPPRATPSPPDGDSGPEPPRSEEPRCPGEADMERLLDGHTSPAVKLEKGTNCNNNNSISSTNNSTNTSSSLEMELAAKEKEVNIPKKNYSTKKTTNFSTKKQNICFCVSLKSQEQRTVASWNLPG